MEAQGSTNYAAIRPAHVLGYEIPLPPLAEQRRIVARIQDLAAEISKARGLREEAIADCELLPKRVATLLLDDAGWTVKPLGHVLAEAPRNGLSPKPEVEASGRPMLRINSVSSAPSRFVDLTAVKYVDVSDEEATSFVLQADDVFVVRYNGDINRVAKAAIFKTSSPSRAVFPDKLIRLRPDHSVMIPDFLVLALSARSVREQVELLGKTTAGNIGVSGTNVKTFKVPVPPISDQQRIISELDAVEREVTSLKCIQTETAAELNALLPAVLDLAFNGGL